MKIDKTFFLPAFIVVLFVLPAAFCVYTAWVD